MRQNRHGTKMYVVHRNTLSDSFRMQIVWFQQKQDSDRIRISFFKNRIGSDSENPLSDHLCNAHHVSLNVQPWGWALTAIRVCSHVQIQRYDIIKVTDLVWLFMTQSLFWTHDCYTQQDSNTYFLVTFSTFHQTIIVFI